MKQTINKILNWMKTHKPLDWKWILITVLLIQLFKKNLIWSMMVFAGLVTYPNKINYVSISKDAGEKIGIIYADAITRLYEIGFNLGAALHPYNLLMAKIINYIIILIMITLIIFLSVWFTNSMMYNKKLKRKHSGG